MSTEPAVPAIDAEVVPEQTKALQLAPPSPQPVQHVPRQEPRPGEVGGYAGAGMTLLTKKQSAALMAVFGPEAYDIKPTAFGEVFVAQTHVRHRLNEVLGPGRWTLVPIQTGKGDSVFFKGKDGNVETVCLRARLYIHGNFISEAIGEQVLASDRMTYATACEGAKSDALTRCAKDLSIGWHCWDKRWCDNWRRDNAVLVQVKRRQDVTFLWRRKDAPPLHGEMGRAPQQVAADEFQVTAPLITKGQESDLWALITETYPAKTAEATAKKVLATFGFDSFHKITVDKYPALVDAIKRGR